MQKSGKAIALVVVMLSSVLFPLEAPAVGEMPDKETCASAKNPVIAGGCVATDRQRGNCMACHGFHGLENTGLQPGNIGPPLVALKARYPQTKQLRSQLWDATQANPNSVMPPYGRHRILTDKELDQLVEWLYTL
jgi:L-cysteine S-thiosulfotransferase